MCGSVCEAQSAGHVMHCTDADCGAVHFPRTDPAVIMLVTHGDRALLGHAKRFPGNMYSTLAGFVEPGESLEEAVAREVFEETGVRVARVAYHSSQPWPFPGSIMLGFYAEALGEDDRAGPRGTGRRALVHAAPRSATMTRTASPSRAATASRAG